MDLKGLVIHDPYYYNYDILRGCIDDKIPLSEEGKAAAAIVEQFDKSIADIGPGFSRRIMNSKVVNSIIEQYSVAAYYLSACRCMGGFPVARIKGVDIEFDYFQQPYLIDEACEGFFAKLKSILAKRCFPEFHKWPFLLALLAILSIVVIPMSIVTEILMAIAVISLFFSYTDAVENRPIQYLLYFSCIALLGIAVVYLVGSDVDRPADMENFLIVKTLGLISNGLLALFVVFEYLFMLLKKRKNRVFEKEYIDYFENNYMAMVHFIEYHQMWWKHERKNDEYPIRINKLVEKYEEMFGLYQTFSDQKRK